MIVAALDLELESTLETPKSANLTLHIFHQKDIVRFNISM